MLLSIVLCSQPTASQSSRSILFISHSMRSKLASTSFRVICLSHCPTRRCCLAHLLTHESEQYRLSRGQLKCVSLLNFLHYYIVEYICEATSAFSTFRQLEVQHLFRKYVVVYSSHLICLSHGYLLGVFAHLSTFFLDMRVLHVITMHHQRGVS